MTALGYARVSTKAQHPDLQVDALKAAGCAEVFIDRAASGTLARRPQLDELLARAEDGDEIVVWKLDRLGRNTHNLLLLLDEMKSRGVHFRSLTEGISTTGAMGTAMATVMAAFTNATSYRNGPAPACRPPRRKVGTRAAQRSARTPTVLSRRCSIGMQG